MITKYIWLRGLLSVGIFATAMHVIAPACRADDVFTFDLIPADGNLSSLPGGSVGWGYSITNDSTTDWLLTTNLVADPFSNGTPALLFDFPEVGPGQTVSENFDPIGLTGLYEDVLNVGATSGDSGNFDLSAEWYDGDPFNGGNDLGPAQDAFAAYSVAVTSSSAVPEPSTLPLLIGGVLLLGATRLRQSPRILGRTVRSAAGRSALVAVLVVAMSGAGWAQEDSKEPGITRQQADDILLELRAIHELLDGQVSLAPAPRQPAAPAMPTSGKLKLDGEFSRGSDTAPVTIVEFTDYECPFCRQFESTTLVELTKKYIDTGKARVLVHDFPLNIHADAIPAAEAARCAADQGKFWQMHDSLFSDPGKLTLPDLIARADSMKLDGTVYKSCLESGKHKPEILKAVKTASDMQIATTPSFLMGKTKGDVVEGAIIMGAQPLAAFAAKLNEAAAGK